MNNILKIMLGLLLTAGTFLLVLPGFPLESWGYAAVKIIKGTITIIVPLAGIMLIILGFSELKN